MIIVTGAAYYAMSYLITMPPSVLPDTFVETEYTKPLDYGSGKRQYSVRYSVSNRFTFQRPLSTEEPSMVTRVWYGAVSKENIPRPTVVLLHGAGRNGASMIDMWADIAATQGINLIAPDSYDVSWTLSHDGPDFLEAILREAEKQFPIARDQLYLFGHSSGAVLAQFLANRKKGPWISAGSHGGTIRYDNIGENPDGIPIYSFIGKKDEAFPFRSVRNAAIRLAQAGHHVELTVIPDHNHWFYEIGRQIVPDIWRMMRRDS